MTRFIAGLADDAPNPAIESSATIYDAIGYRGSVTQWRGLGWTHSLQRFGTEAFESRDLAEIDFWSTKAGLPSSVHEVLFGIP